MNQAQAAGPILEVRNLQKNFGRMAAVNQLSLAFKEGEFVSVIGPNGAGKTTFINLVSGKLKPSGGKVFFQGRDITGLPPYRITALGIARIFQITNLFPELSVYENIRVPVLARLGKCSSCLAFDSRHQEVNQETQRIMDLVRLTPKGDEEAGTLSHGDQRLLEVGVALASKPTLLLMDEPTGGMAPEETEAMVDFVRDLAQAEGVTILLVEHDMSVVFSISQRVVVLHQGSLLSDGDPDHIRADQKVRDAYLGE